MSSNYSEDCVVTASNIEEAFERVRELSDDGFTDVDIVIPSEMPNVFFVSSKSNPGYFSYVDVAKDSCSCIHGGFRYADKANGAPVRAACHHLVSARSASNEIYAMSQSNSARRTRAQNDASTAVVSPDKNKPAARRKTMPPARLESLVRATVESKVYLRESFTAYDVTKTIRDAFPNFEVPHNGENGVRSFVVRFVTNHLMDGTYYNDVVWFGNGERAIQYIHS